jgi:ABC-type phosphate transport system substrate-binding protein
MGSRRTLWIGAGIVAALLVVVAVTLALTPAQTNPAFAAAETFVRAAGQGDDATALALLSDQMQTYVAANCPNESVSACVDSFTPPEWGAMRSAVYRRATPDGAAWDVDIISHYEADTGASGVCIYGRVEQNAAGEWRVAGWAGFVHCGDPASRNMAANPDAPNRAP